MPKPRKTVKLPTPRSDNQNYDLGHLTSIVGAMAYLRTEAGKTQVEEVATVVESAFNLLRIAHDRLLPHDGSKLSASEQQDPDAGSERSRPQRLEGIVSAMDYLRTEALKTGMEEIVIIVESTFHIVCAAYYCILRRDMMGLPPSDATFPHGL
jgi:hypothetical protein